MSEEIAELAVSETQAVASPPPVEATASLRDQIRARIKGAPAYSSKKVYVPDWDIEIEVRSMPLGRRNDILRLGRGEDGSVDPSKLSILAAIESIYDSAGEQVFGPADTGWLSSMDAQKADVFLLPVLQLNGFSGSPIEDSAKKSDSTETSV